MKKVLLILRDFGSRRIMWRLLKDRYELVICEHPTEAEKELTQQFDAVIMDMMFPGAVGFDFLRDNAGRLPEVIVAISEYWPPNLDSYCPQYGIKAVYRSPFNPHSVADCLDDFFPDTLPYLTPRW